MVLDRFSTLVAAFFKKNEHCRLHVRGCKVPGSQSVVESMQPAKGALLLLEIRLARICLCCFSWHGWFCWRGRGAVATSVCAKMFGHWHICHGIFHGSLARVRNCRVRCCCGAGQSSWPWLWSRACTGTFFGEPECRELPQRSDQERGGGGEPEGVNRNGCHTKGGGAQPDWGGDPGVRFVADKNGPERASKTREYDSLRIRTGQKEPPRRGSTICYG